MTHNTEGFIARSLFRILRESKPEWAECFLDMQERAVNDWLQLMKADQGSLGGLQHLVNVGRNVEKIVVNPKDLEPSEIFLLLCAVLFHDIGRILSSKCTKPQTGECDKAGAPCAKDSWNHHKESRRILEDYGRDLGLPDQKAAEYCGILAYSHGFTWPPTKDDDSFSTQGSCCDLLLQPKEPRYRNTSVEPYGTVRIPLLGAILRIADETEHHWTRALNDRWLRPETPEDKLRKYFRRRVEDVEFCHAGQCIIFHLNEQPEGKDLESFQQVTEEVGKVLRYWKDDLLPLSMCFDRVFWEWDGRLHRLEHNTPLHSIADLFGTEAEDARENDCVRMKKLLKALVRLSCVTMNYPKFSWSSIEAQAGWRLTDKDKWLVEHIADWAPGAVVIDRRQERVIVDHEGLNKAVRELEIRNG